MRKLYYILLIILGVIEVRAQRTKVDSLEAVIVALKQNDKNWVNAANELSEYYRYISVSSSLDYANKALDSSSVADYQEGQVDALINIGICYGLLNNDYEATSYIRRAIRISEAADYTRGFAKAFTTYGVIFQILGQKNEALKFNQRALDTIRVHELEGAYMPLGNIGVIYLESNESERALDYLFNASHAAKSEGRIDYYVHSLNLIGLAYKNLLNFTDAEIYFQRAMGDAKKAGLQTEIARAALYQGNLDIQRKLYDKAANYLDTARLFSEAGDNKKLIGETFLAYTNLYELTGQEQKALDAFRQYHTIVQDSISGEVSYYIAELSVMFEREQQQRQYEQLKEEKELQTQQASQRQVYNYILFGVVTMMLMFAFSFLRSSSRNRDKNTMLKTQKEQIEVQKIRLEDTLKNIELLSEIGKDITANLSAEMIVDTVYENLNALMDASVFGVGIYTPDHNQLEFKGTKENGKTSSTFYYDVTQVEHMAVWCFTEQKEVVMSDYPIEYHQYVPIMPLPKDGQTTQSVIYYPVTLKDDRIGVITVQSFRKNAYSHTDVNIVKNLAVYLAIALDNAAAYTRIETQERALRRMNTTKDKMFSIIGHDLRSPIGNFTTILEFLVDESEQYSKEDLVDMLVELRQSASSTFNLLDNLLNWAKSQQGEIIYRPDIVDVFVVVNENFELLKGSADVKKIELLCNVTPKFLVFADDNMITTVIRNLISNAIKFTPEKGKITVNGKFTTVGDSRMAEFSVSDSGIGISKENLAKIFNKGEHFTTYGTNNEKGSGLGLVLCQDFVERNNGRIWVESKQGEGSTFKFTLPLPPKKKTEHELDEENE